MVPRGAAVALELELEHVLSVLSDWGLWSQAVLLDFFLWVRPRGSRASLRGRRGGRRMMGPGRRGVSICFTTLQAFGPRALDSHRDRLALRPHGNDPLHPPGEFLVCVFFVCLVKL